MMYLKELLKDYNVLLWDFDGVLMRSNEIRDRGFLEVLKSYPQDQVDQLMKYHQANGGLSRYVKFRYFFEQIRNEEITEEQIQVLATSFSAIMLSLLTNPDLLIIETISFVKENFHKTPMHIVSGSDGNELRYLCDSLDISQYFISIGGSPTPKKQLVKDLLQEYKYDTGSCALVGDSINDYEAAHVNNIHFVGYGNDEIKKYSTIDFDLK